MSSSLTTQGPHPNAPFGMQARMSPVVALVWKQLSDMSQAFVVLTAGSAAVSVLTAWAMSRGGGGHDVFYSIITLFTCAFALAACFISFVIEFESRTRDFLSSLPISSVLVGLVKQWCAALAVAVFFGVQLLIRLAVLSLLTRWSYRYQLGYSFADPTSLYYVALIVSVVFISCLICCSFWSTSWMSVACALPLTWLLVAASISYGLFSQPTLEPEVSWGYQFTSQLVLVAALAAAILIPLFWLRRRPMLRRLPAIVGPMDHAEDDFFYSELPGKLGLRTPALLAMPGRDRFPALCWQSVRQQALMPLLAVLCLGLMAWLFGLVMEMSPRRPSHPQVQLSMQTGLLFVMTMAGYGFGVAALYRDKLNSNFNFFQQHREYGRELLLARILFPLLLLSATAVVGHGIITLFTGGATGLGVSVIAGLSAFTVSLMWSMAFRSHIYALGVALVLASTMNSFFSLWLVHKEFEYTWVVVLPFVWLVTCFAYAPTWLSGRRRDDVLVIGDGTKRLRNRFLIA